MHSDHQSRKFDLNPAAPHAALLGGRVNRAVPVSFPARPYATRRSHRTGQRQDRLGLSLHGDDLPAGLAAAYDRYHATRLSRAGMPVADEEGQLDPNATDRLAPSCYNRTDDNSSPGAYTGLQDYSNGYIVG